MRLLRRVAAWGLVATVLGGCRSKAADVAERLDTSISWLATVEAVMERWDDNRLPRRFAEGVITQARDALHGAAEEPAARAVSAAGDAVRSGDRRGAPVLLAQLRSAREAIAERRARLRGSG